MAERHWRKMLKSQKKERGFEGFSLSNNVASENEIDEVVAQAGAAGAAPVKEPQKVFWGGYSRCFKDPDGYLWAVAHNPLFRVGPSDIKRTHAEGRDQ